MLKKNPVITLTTDFGLKDPFVGIMKGVIFGINPDVRVIDISHNITPHNIHEAAQVLSLAYTYFPPASIHIAVIDPHVGAARRPILVVTEDYYFIGPDNGVFTPFFEEQSTMSRVIHINAPHFFLPIKGPTFHGRDIFAPVAAWLSKGIRSFKFGDTIDDYVRLPLHKPKTTDENTVEGEVVHIDNFGNAITNINNQYLAKFDPDFLREKSAVFYKKKQMSLSSYYAQTEGAGLSAIFNSFGLLELFVYKEDAARKFGINIGDKVSVTVA
jgi:S-adenosylmethionine hydrolase